MSYQPPFQVSVNKTDSGIFIDFMLGEILKTLKERKGEPLKTNEGINEGVNEGVFLVFEFIKNNPLCRVPAISKYTGIPSKSIERYIKQLREQNKIEFVGAPKNGGYREKE